MKSSEQHCKTKLTVTMDQIEGLFDECDDATKLLVLGTIVTGDADGNDDELVPMTIDCIRSLFTELSDDQRMELVKSVIWTAPDMHTFYKKVEKMVSSNEFQRTLD
jgi:hypothetical protein